MDPERHIRYVNISGQNMWRSYRLKQCRQSLVQPQNTAVSWVCALSGTGGSVDVWSSDPSLAQVSGVGVWGRAFTADWTWYMFLTLPAKYNESPNLGRPTCSQVLRSTVPTAHAMFPHVEALQIVGYTKHLLHRQTEASAAFTDWNLNLRFTCG